MGMNEKLADQLAQSVVAGTVSLQPSSGVPGTGRIAWGTSELCAIGLCTQEPAYEVKEHVVSTDPPQYQETRMLISHEIDPLPGWTPAEAIAHGAERLYPSYARTQLGKIIPQENATGSTRITANMPMVPNDERTREKMSITPTDIPYGTVMNYEQTIFFNICDEESGRWPTVSHFGLFSAQKADVADTDIFRGRTGDLIIRADRELQWWGALSQPVTVENDQAPVFKQKNLIISVTSETVPITT